MSFQAYLDNLEAKSGKTIAELTRVAEAKGFVKGGKLTATAKAGDIVAWLAADHGVGRGHAMALFAYFKGKRE